jgi:hypothetical protein
MPGNPPGPVWRAASCHDARRATRSSRPPPRARLPPDPETEPFLPVSVAHDPDATAAKLFLFGVLGVAGLGPHDPLLGFCTEGHVS